METMNRELWLNEMARRHVWPHLARALVGMADHGELVAPPHRISVGFPKGSRGGRMSIGQAWKAECSADAHREVFISPVLDAGGPAGAVATLVHELIHVWDNNEHGHKGPFRKLAQAAGLTGKMTATVAGEGLLADISSWIASLGPYPHATLNPGLGRSPPGSRLLKVACPDCEYTVRVTAKWINVGLPTCPCGTEMGAA